MLAGKDPLLVILLQNKGFQNFFGNPALDVGIGEIPLVPGIPIPIYFSPLLGLTEGATGIFIDNEASAIDVETRVDPIFAKDPSTGETLPPVVSQTAADAQLTINLVASRDSIILTVLLALMDVIVSKLVTAEYSINYLNGPTAIFGAKLHRFATSVNRNDTLVRCELVLSTASKDQPTAKAVIQAVPKQASTVTLGGA